MKILLVTLALVVFAGTASADSIWDYQGNTMQGCNCALTGSLTLADQHDTNFANQLFTPVSYDFSVAGFDFTPQDSTASFYLTFTGGQLTLWSIHIYDITDSGYIMTYSYDIAEATDGFMLASGATGGEEGNRGSWAESVPTPEPGTLALVGVGLVGLLARKRLQAKRTQVPETVWEPLS